MEKFTIEELGYFVTLCGAVAVSCVAVVIKSRCKTIETPCLKCKREVLHEKTEQVLKQTTSNNSTTQIEGQNPHSVDIQNTPQIEGDKKNPNP
jgi:mannose/cellobiose epimerase-like protein (N-acyl-D-glucosamine 2-epimerase family)